MFFTYERTFAIVNAWFTWCEERHHCDYLGAESAAACECDHQPRQPHHKDRTRRHRTWHTAVVRNSNDGSLATPVYRRSSPTVNIKSLTSDVNNEPSPEQYEKCWSYATRDADSQVVTPHPAGPTDTTSPIGSTVAQPQRQTDACCAAVTTTTSTKPDGPSPATPTTNSSSPHPPAPCSTAGHPASPPKTPPDHTRTRPRSS